MTVAGTARAARRGVPLRPGRKGEYAAEILDGFNGTIQVDAYGAYTHLATPKRTGGDPLRLAFCWAHGRRKLIKAKPKKGSPIVDEALLRIAALYKIEDAIRGSDPDHRRAVRQELSRPLVDEFFTWLKAQAARVSRKSDLGEAMAYMLKRQDGFRLFLDDGRVDIDSNLVENAIRSPAMNRRNALFAGHDEGGRNWARFASLIGTCKMNGVEPYAYLRDLFTKLANGHLARDIDALMPWAYVRVRGGAAYHGGVESPQFSSEKGIRRAVGLQRAGGAILFPGDVPLEAVLSELRPTLRLPRRTLEARPHVQPDREHVRHRQTSNEAHQRLPQPKDRPRHGVQTDDVCPGEMAQARWPQPPAGGHQRG
jgi:transposase